MQSKAVAQKINFDRQLSTLAEVEWTPTFYLGGELIDQRDMTTSEFLTKLRSKIDEELKARGIAVPEHKKSQTTNSKE